MFTRQKRAFKKWASPKRLLLTVFILFMTGLLILGMFPALYN